MLVKFLDKSAYRPPNSSSSSSVFNLPSTSTHFKYRSALPSKHSSASKLSKIGSVVVTTDETVDESVKGVTGASVMGVGGASVVGISVAGVVPLVDGIMLDSGAFVGVISVVVAFSVADGVVVDALCDVVINGVVVAYKVAVELLLIVEVVGSQEVSIVVFSGIEEIVTDESVVDSGSKENSVMFSLAVLVKIVVVSA